jgi:hypothetical protein
MISSKNKANSNPIQSQSKPILAQKSGGKPNTKPTCSACPARSEFIEESEVEGRVAEGSDPTCRSEAGCNSQLTAYGCNEQNMLKNLEF